MKWKASNVLTPMTFTAEMKKVLYIYIQIYPNVILKFLVEVSFLEKIK